MVGGTVIEAAQDATGIRLWCADRNGDECAVHVEDPQRMIQVGDQVWWQAGKVYWTPKGSDKARDIAFPKIGYSFDPRRSAP